MKKIVALMLFAAAIFAFSGTADAQIEEGDKELTASISFQSISVEDVDDSTDSLMFMGSFGYCFTVNHEAGLSLMLMATSVEGDLVGMGPLQLFYTYHIITQNPKMVPFLGGNAGKIVFLGDGAFGTAENPSIWLFGLNGGIKFFVSEDTAVVPQLIYQRMTISIEELDDSLSANTIMLMVGLSTFF